MAGSVLVELKTVLGHDVGVVMVMDLMRCSDWRMEYRTTGFLDK